MNPTLTDLPTYLGPLSIVVQDGTFRINKLFPSHLLMIPPQTMDKIPSSFGIPSGNTLRQFLFSPASAGLIITTLLGIWVASHVFRVVYNISPFHPLSRFPGPKIAAATYAYEAYYDWIMGGRYGKRIAAMHEKYGKWTTRQQQNMHLGPPNNSASS